MGAQNGGSVWPGEDVQARRGTTAETTESGPARRWVRGAAIATVASFTVLVACTPGGDPDTRYLGASHVPDSMPGWQKYQTGKDPDAPLDEAMGGRTARGTPVNKRMPECFPAETRNVFSQVDQVSNRPGDLHPFDYTDGHAVTAAGRDAIRGQNTWMMWGEGNEAFWGWLQERGYGLVDFLVLLDSRHRNERFKKGGILNQPGMVSRTTPIEGLGLYLDQADPNSAEFELTSPASDIDPATHQLVSRPGPPPANNESCAHCHANPKLRKPFEVGDQALYDRVIKQLAKDGVDPGVYGYPSGVVGLRLFPNPDFFGTGPVAVKARQYWAENVVNKGDAYYDNSKDGPHIQQDPNLIRPFRVSMSCAFCHLGPHPLKPPADPENPSWANLSSTIGNQYWAPQPLFANLMQEDSILYQFLKSQQPGTIDTSLVSTDHINNANTITAVFDVDARLTRASVNQSEKQSDANLLSPIANLAFPLAVEHGQKEDPRHTPRVLLDGSDSIGAFGALSRVYLNIGTFPENWARCHNPIIGFKPQRPFSLATLQSNSVYWQTSERYRIPYLAAFFTYKAAASQKSIVAPMKLANIIEGQAELAKDTALAVKGREVFLNNCTLCHSSKQPDGFELTFSPKWRNASIPGPKGPARFTLPSRFADWEEFRNGKAYAEYKKRILEVAQGKNQHEDFFENNFLSTDVRIPVTLVGTNSGRAVGTNAMSGQVWDNFSSDSYKALPAVGAVYFYNPFSHGRADEWGNNDAYYPPPGGPGYYRPASLISLWATAPYLHNNSLGLYPQTQDHVPDPSVAGRLVAFNDGIEKLFAPMAGRKGSHVYGDLRGQDLDGVIGGDPGFIYRIAVESSISFSPKFTRAFFEGLLGPWVTRFATEYVWIVLTILALVLVVIARPRHAAFVLLLVALGAFITILLTRFDRLWLWLWLIPVLALVLALYLWLTSPSRVWSRVIFVLFAVGFAYTGFTLKHFVYGDHPGQITVSHIPRGTPINLLMNINPEAPMPNLIRAGAGLVRGIVLSQRAKNGKKASDAEVLDIFQREAGQPLLEASKCPDFVLDRGHWFAKDLTPEEKDALKAFLKTL